MRLTILTGKELRHKLLTFTIFIIQSQVGAIPVFSRLSFSIAPPSWKLAGEKIIYLNVNILQVQRNQGLKNPRIMKVFAKVSRNEIAIKPRHIKIYHDIFY